jgi:hypothetical protein
LAPIGNARLLRIVTGGAKQVLVNFNTEHKSGSCFGHFNYLKTSAASEVHNGEAVKSSQEFLAKRCGQFALAVVDGLQG